MSLVDVVFHVHSPRGSFSFTNEKEARDYFQSLKDDSWITEAKLVRSEVIESYEVPNAGIDS